MMDSIPVVCISGQVPTHMIGNDAFQEADIVGITRPCTKHNYLVKDVNKLQQVIHEGFLLHQTEAGPYVLIDIKKDIQTFKAPTKEKSSFKKPILYRSKDINQDSSLNQFVEMLQKTKKPIVYIGGGVINSGISASKQLYKFLKYTHFSLYTNFDGFRFLSY